MTTESHQVTRLRVALATVVLAVVTSLGAMLVGLSVMHDKQPGDMFQFRPIAGGGQLSSTGGSLHVSPITVPRFVVAEVSTDGGSAPDQPATVLGRPLTVDMSPTVVQVVGATSGALSTRDVGAAGCRGPPAFATH